MIHVVAQQVRTRSEFDDGERVAVVGIDVGTFVVGCGHTAAQFARKIGIFLVALVDFLLLFAQQVGSDGGGGAEALEVERLVVVAGRLAEVLVPESVGVVTVERKHLSERYGGRQFGPAGACVEGEIEADVECDSLQVHQVFAAAAVFVVELARHERSSVLPLQSDDLGVDLAVQFLGITEEHGFAGAQFAALAEHPVGDAAVAYLAVTEGADSEHYGQSLGLADFEEAAQVALSVPPEDAFLLLDVVPEHIGGDNGHTALLHFTHLALPFVGGDAAVLDFAHHGNHAVAVDDEALAVPRHGTSEVVGLCYGSEGKCRGQQQCR